jgi:hypothetical protein
VRKRKRRGMKIARSTMTHKSAIAAEGNTRKRLKTNAGSSKKTKNLALPTGSQTKASEGARSPRYQRCGSQE